jgi:5-methylcytosine-specific restriction enzyme subunit McrC
MRQIPIANLYYLLSYAWRHVEEADIVSVDEIRGFQRLHELFGEVLARGTSRLVRKGLDRGYLEKREDLRGIRGKPLISDYVIRCTRARGRMPCQFEDLSIDVLHNQILRTSLGALFGLDDLDRGVRENVRCAHRLLSGVSDTHLDRSAFRQVQLDANRRDYRFLLAVCQLLYEGLAVEKGKGGAETFLDFRDDRDRMWELFEDFVREFYSREQSEFAVNRYGRCIPWSRHEDARGVNESLIPRMEADIILESSNRRIILDTKFYLNALQSRWGTPKLRSGHLYQLLAYLRNREATTSPGPRHEGVLLYPTVSRSLAVDVELEGHRIRASSIDLAQPWERIHADLLQLLAA